MEDYLGDTSVIFRWATPDDPQCASCRRAIRRLYRQNARVFITAQVLV
jgi:glutaredoxin-related protein